MSILCRAVLALLVLVVCAPVASAQVQVGTEFTFEHDDLDTEHYELCVDFLVDCRQIAVSRVGPVGGLTGFRFTLPSWVPRGNHTLAVRAVGFGDFGPSGLSNMLTERIIGKPIPPINLQKAVGP